MIEHNLDVIKTADRIIDLGPEGGEEGGELVATGTPEEVAARRAAPTPAASCAELVEPAKPKRSAAPSASSRRSLREISRWLKSSSWPGRYAWRGDNRRAGG